MTSIYELVEHDLTPVGEVSFEGARDLSSITYKGRTAIFDERLCAFVLCVIPSLVTYETAAKTYTLIEIGFRLPEQGDLYLGRDKRVHRMKGVRICRNRMARKCVILQETWEVKRG